MTRVVLETERLSFREFVPEDIEFVVEMTSDPDVMQYYPHPLSRAESEWWLNSLLERTRRDGYSLWVVSRIGETTPIGQIGVLKQEVEGEVHHEVGYLLHKAYWKQGYATEAAAGCIRYVFETLGADHVVSLIRPENRPSQRVALRNGLAITRQVQFKELSHDLWWKDR